MRSASPELIEAISRESTTLCGLWDVRRADGTHFRFTDTDRPVEFDDGDGVETYRADVSFNASAVLTSSQFAMAQSVTITTILAADGISEEDIRSRRYQAAVGTLTIVDWEHPEHGGLVIFKGIFGQLKVTDKDRLTIELVPLGQGGFGYIGNERYAPNCRVAFGSARCGRDIEADKIAFTVDSATGRTLVASELSQADDHWKIGVVKWLTGQNAGTTSQVATSDQSSTSLTVVEPPTFAIAAGDTGDVYPGCNKQPTQCLAYGQMSNFRGEPYVPQSIYYKAPTLVFRNRI